MTISVIILGGFLGAGKTTAINHLLADATCRMGVLVNDFGAVNIDAALISARDGDMLALTNGCVCCSLGSDLSESIARLATRMPPPERIVIEASGVSDPWKIAQLARLEKRVRLDAVLVLVDATSFTTHLTDRWLTDTLERQIARADLVVLSKCDLADEAARNATRSAVRCIRPDVPMVEIAGGAIPDLLLGGDHPGGSPYHDHKNGDHENHYHGDGDGHGFQSWFWRENAPLDRGRLEGVLRSLPDAVLRAKGFCRLGPEALPHLLQLVGRRWTLEPWDGTVTEPGFVLIATEAMPRLDQLGPFFAGTIRALSET